MNFNAVFTICAKNYLAQALTLKNSCIKNNPDIDFYIFLSDYDNNSELNSIDIIHLDDSWIKGWRKMAFQYNVIEFSTSIKPFCLKRLFDLNYEKVIYLDPDIYVTNSLVEIFNFLDQKSVVLTPHYCNIQTNYTGSITEEEILFVGIYNLGFIAICNNIIGKSIVNWWMNRLYDKCYADKNDALHVDQKWMDFIPAFFPNDILITHHMGINPAIWNLHERELFISNSGQYKISNKVSKESFSLLFFHFSGFDPYNPKLINRRHPKYNTEVYPTYKPLFDDYVKEVYENDYEKYSKMTYSFNSFLNGENIIALHRRLFRVYNLKEKCENPFNESEHFFSYLKSNKLLTGIKSNAFSTYSTNQKSKKSFFENSIILSFKIIKRVFGIRYYSSLLIFINEITRFERQTFLSNGKK